MRIDGISMEPNFHNNSVNLIYTLAYAWSKPERGDVVGVRWVGSKVLLLKRIVALPGETIEFSRGHILINGRVLSEPYIRKTCTWGKSAIDPPRTLGPDEYYIVGDNREMPPENHTKGAYTLDKLIGRAVFGGSEKPSLITE